MLLEAGSITISANAGTESGTITVDIAVPPTIVFDLLKNGNRDIYRASLDGKDTVRLTSDLGDDSDPTVAGDVVVFVSFRDGNGELYMTSLEGGPPTRLTSTDVAEASPALSPDTTLLAYTRSEAGVPKLWIAASDGSNAGRVTADFGFAGSIETSPSWEPNGERVVFVSTSEGTADIFTHTVSTGSFSLLVPDSAFRAEVEPAWNPDGSQVAFATDRTGDTEVYLIQVASGALTRLTNRPGPDGQPTWVGDGRLVYVAWVEGTPRLRWIDPASPNTVHDIDIGSGEPGHPSGTWNGAYP
jgi:Tol biopolymer transport system component